MCFIDKVAELLTSAWPMIFAYDAGRYLIAAPAVFLLVHILFRRWLIGRKIQARNARLADIRREFLYSMLTVAIFATVGLGVYHGAEVGVMKVYFDVADHGWGYFLGSLALIVIAHDAYFYWAHRLMHHKRLFRFFHLAHHRSRTPTPFAAYAFAPGEAFVQAIFLPLFLVVVPMHEVAIFLFMAHQIGRNAIGHAGYELFPKGWTRSPWLRWCTTVTHHDLHHETFHWNYGLYFSWWDRLMGTEHPDYGARFASVTETAGRSRESRPAPSL